MITVLLGEPGTGKTTEARKMAESKSSEWFTAKELLKNTTDKAFKVIFENSHMVVVEEVISLDQVKELCKKIASIENPPEVIITSQGLRPEEFDGPQDKCGIPFKVISLDQQHNKMLHSWE